jgi:hypothetical protein
MCSGRVLVGISGSVVMAEERMSETEKEIARNIGYLRAKRMQEEIKRRQWARQTLKDQQIKEGTYVEPTPEQLANPSRRITTENRLLRRANEAIRFHQSDEFAQQYAPPPTTTTTPPPARTRTPPPTTVTTPPPARTRTPSPTTVTTPPPARTRTPSPTDEEFRALLDRLGVERPVKKAKGGLIKSRKKSSRKKSIDGLARKGKTKGTQR